MDVFAAARDFHRLEDQLLKNHPAAAARVSAEVAKLVDSSTADAELIWSVFWDKPVRSARKFRGGDTLVDRAAPLMPSRWRSAGVSWIIKKIDLPASQKLHWKKDGNYSFSGQFVAELNAKGVPIWAINSIHHAAIYLQLLVSKDPVAPFSYLKNNFDRRKALLDLQDELEAKEVAGERSPYCTSLLG